MTSTSRASFDRYALWVEGRRWPILVFAGLLAALGGWLAVGMPLRADFSYLLPPNERSVRDLDRVENRAPVLGLAICAVASDDPVRRAAAAQALANRVRALDPSLVASVIVDDGPARRFGWEHRFLFASLEDLETARDGLQARLRRAKLGANPFYVSLDDDETTGRHGAASREPFDELRRKLDAAEEKLHHPDALVSKDGRMQLVMVQAPFPSAAVAQGERLIAALEGAIRETRREIGGGVDFGITEDVVIAVSEHRAVLGGMSLAILITVVVVGVSMLLYYRSVVALLALMSAVAVGTLLTFGVARLAIGHLNSISAFLSSIVVGNGINFGILVLARHLEERRKGEPASRALAKALGGSYAGTITAACAASVAYASLVVTDFRGFRDFGIIGGIGMLLCWGAAYTVLPAMLSAFESRGLVRVHDEPAIGPLVARLLPQRPSAVIAAIGLLALGAIFVTARYLRADPFEYDWQQLRSDRGLAAEARAWMARIDRAFGRQLVGGFIVGLDDGGQSLTVERALRAKAEDEPGAKPGTALFRNVGSLRSLLPESQTEKLAVLAEVRRLCDDDKLAALDPHEAADLRRFRPPDGLRALTDADVPEALARRYVERDGTRGRLLYANQASRFDGWNGRDMIAFAAAVRALDLPSGVAMAGGAFVFADILQAVKRAGLRSTVVALLGVAAFVVVLLGRGRHAAITLLCAATGTVFMVAGAALLGLKVNSLDFVALPITLGIGVDYAVNVVARERNEGMGAARLALATTAGAVMLCSWTTTVGYASLLLSANAGIRSFGIGAILGEVACLLMALTLAPSLLAEFAPRARARARV